MSHAIGLNSDFVTWDTLPRHMRDTEDTERPRRVEGQSLLYTRAHPLRKDKLGRPAMKYGATAANAPSVNAPRSAPWKEVG